MKCNNCKMESNDLSLFAKDSSRKNGYKNWCLSCIRNRSKQYTINNRNKISIKKKNKYNNNILDVKQYYIDRMLNDVIKYRAEVIHHGMSGSSRKFGTEFDSEYFSITNIKYLLSLINKCPCCNKMFVFESLLNGQKNMAAPSADRFNTNYGYTKDNVVFICWECNKLKRDTTIHELKIVVDWLESKINV